MSKEHYNSIDAFNSDASSVSTDSKSLELLFDYTKFHIGVYLTLSTTYVALATLEELPGKLLLSVNPSFLWVALFFTALAGLAGGIIVSSITQIESTKTSDFFKCSIGPWEWKRIHFNAKIWTYIEHTSFWIGLACAVSSLVYEMG